MTQQQIDHVRVCGITQCEPGIARGISLTPQSRDSHVRRVRAFYDELEALRFRLRWHQLFN